MGSAASIELHELAGFQVSLGEDGRLVFGAGAVAPEPSSRVLKDLSQVLLYPGEPGPDPLYLMYRGTGAAADQRAMEDCGLRYDITVIYPGLIGSEYIKTLGHYHPKVPGQPWTYPEVYQVLHGEAHFLLQRGGEVSGQVDDFIVADFEEGDILVIPPFYGHVTANPGDVPLVMANWIARDFQSVYDPIKLRKGLAFYDVEYKGQSIFMPNESYGEHPKPRIVKPVDYSDIGLTQGQSMYRAWRDGADMSFLVKPSRASTMWESLGVQPQD